MEPLLAPNNDRLVVLPVAYPDIYAMYKKAVASFWVAEEIDLSKDLDDWAKLTEDEKYFLSMILAFFAGADGLVNENITFRFYNEIQIAEARLFYGFQSAMEGIHQEVYANLIDTYIKDTTEKNRLLKSIGSIPFITKKADFCFHYIQSSDNFATRLVAFACVEGIMFSGSFCAIYWVKKRGLLKGLTFSNELISRDEALHTEFAILLYNKLQKRLTEKQFHAILSSAVSIEIEFICQSLPCRLIGMNSKLMSQYIQFVADRLSLQMGYNKLYHAANPFDFMELISVESKVNFFENKVSEYALANREMTGDIFNFECDF